MKAVILMMDDAGGETLSRHEVPIPDDLLSAPASGWNDRRQDLCINIASQTFGLAIIEASQELERRADAAKNHYSDGASL